MIKNDKTLISSFVHEYNSDQLIETEDKFPALWINKKSQEIKAYPFPRTVSDFWK
jgi:hypothetical protein